MKSQCNRLLELKTVIRNVFALRRNAEAQYLEFGGSDGSDGPGYSPGACICSGEVKYCRRVTLWTQVWPKILKGLPHVKNVIRNTRHFKPTKGIKIHSSTRSVTFGDARSPTQAQKKMTAHTKTVRYGSAGNRTRVLALSAAAFFRPSYPPDPDNQSCLSVALEIGY